MKVLIYAILTFVPIFSFGSNNNDQKLLAERAIFKLEMYQNKVTYIHRIADLATQNDAEKIEKELALCHAIGESDGRSTELYLSIHHLMSTVFDEDDRHSLAQSEYDVSIHNIAMGQGFCFQSNPEKYRNIELLKLDLKIIESDFPKIEPILRKYKNL